MNTTWMVLLGVGAALAVGGYLLVRLWPAKEETIYHHPCPHCRRRLRYRPRQAGHVVTCPLCKKQLTFPSLPDKK
jgi:ribosomal protein L37AE/L43A